MKKSTFIVLICIILFIIIPMIFFVRYIIEQREMAEQASIEFLKFADSIPDFDEESFKKEHPSTPDTIGTTSEQPAVSSEIRGKWVPLLQVEGSGPKKSRLFKYDGGELRLKYNYSVDNIGGFTVYVIPKGQTLMSYTPNPDVMITKSRNDETALYLNKGEYYLHIEGVNGKYVATIEVRP